MQFTTMKMMAVGAATSSLLGFAAVPGHADDNYNPQTTVDGCSLQGGCPAGAGEAENASPAAESSVTPAQQGALDWLRARLGSADYNGLCLRLAVDAFAQGGGVDIGTAPSALEYWNAHPELQHPG